MIRSLATPAIGTVAALLVACGGTTAPRATAPTRAFGEHGLAVRLPAGWQPARRSLTPHLFDPREVLAVGTYPLRYRAGGCAEVATGALEDLGATDAFVTLQERGRDPGSSWSGFPERPARFGPTLGGASAAGACVPGARFSDHWFGFSDGGRHFHAEVAFGPAASAVTQRQAWAILDSLRIDPRDRPRWRSSG